MLLCIRRQNIESIKCITKSKNEPSDVSYQLYTHWVLNAITKCQGALPTPIYTRTLSNENGLSRYSHTKGTPKRLPVSNIDIIKKPRPHTVTIYERGNMASHLMLKIRKHRGRYGLYEENNRNLICHLIAVGKNTMRF